jgi:hypothetical protein
MSSPASGSLRGLRVAVVAVAGTLLGTGAHAAAGGGLPSPGDAALATVVPALAGLWLTGKRRGWLSIAAVLGLVQFVLHTWLMSSDVVMGCPVGGGGHMAHGAAAVGSCAAGPAPADMPSMAMHSGGHMAGGSAAMVLAHAVAVVATALVLSAGERALWQLLQWLRPALQLVRAAPPAFPGRLAVPVAVTVPLLRDSADLSGFGRRGPPVLS